MITKVFVPPRSLLILSGASRYVVSFVFIIIIIAYLKQLTLNLKFVFISKTCQYSGHMQFLRGLKML